MTKAKKALYLMEIFLLWRCHDTVTILGTVIPTVCGNAMDISTVCGFSMVIYDILVHQLMLVF